MLTQRCQNVISSILYQASIIRAIPFKWKFKEKRLIPLKGWSLVPHILILLILCTNFTCLSISFYKTRKYTSISSTSRSLHFMYGIAGLLAVLFGYNTLKRRHAIANFTNQFFKFHKFLEDEFLVDSSLQRMNSCELMLRTFQHLVYTQSFGSVLLFFRGPLTYRYAFRYIASYVPPWSKFVYVLFEYMLYVNYWFIVLLNLILMFSFWYGTSFWLKQIRLHSIEYLRANIRKKQETLGKLRIPSRSISIFRCFTILNNFFYNSLSEMILPSAHILIVLIPSCSNFILIYAYDKLSLISVLAILTLSMSCFAIAILAYPVAAGLYTLSSSYIVRFKQHHIFLQLTLQNKKRLKSCKPIKIYVGQITFIRHVTVLKLINAMIYWTMKTILIFSLK